MSATAQGIVDQQSLCTDTSCTTYMVKCLTTKKKTQKQTKRSKTTTATKKQKLPMQLVEMPKKGESSPENARAHNAPYSTSPTKNNLFMNTL